MARRRDPARSSGFGTPEASATAAREREMWELRHRGGCPSPGGAVAPPPREGEAAGGDHETESTSDKETDIDDRYGDLDSRTDSDIPDIPPSSDRTPEILKRALSGLSSRF